MARTKQTARKSQSTDTSLEIQKGAKKRTAGEANVAGETPQKRAAIQQTVNPAASSSSSSIPQYVYAVIYSSMKVYTGDYEDHYGGGDEEKPEVLAVYSDVDDANRRVVREYGEWDGTVNPHEESSFDFTGPSYEWQVDSDNDIEGRKVAIEKWTLYGPGSEPVKKRERLIPGEEGFDDEESDD